MQLHEIATQFFADLQASFWPNFAPEAILCLSIMLMLLVRVSPLGRFVPGWVMALLASGTALYYAEPWAYLNGMREVTRSELFTGMLVYDSFTVYVRGFLLMFVVLFALFTRLTRLVDRDNDVDFYCLILGATLGMCLMASANHLLMVFLAVEMASVPSYVLAGQQKFRRTSSEASLKYAVYGAGTAGVMLYGISLIAGVLNSAHLPTLAVRLYETFPTLSGSEQTVLALGGLMLMVGLAFKLSAVPFHFWCPDVFEGASAEVAAFLSVASKAAALALLVRVAIGFTVPGNSTQFTPLLAAEAPMADRAEANGLAHATALVARHPSAATPGLDTERPAVALTDHGTTQTMVAAQDESELVEQTDPLIPVRQYIVLLVGIVAAVTCTFGNLAAYGQTNIKRLLAYSTIAHAGYMMMAVPAAVAAAAVAPETARQSIAALAVYVAIYLFMNLAAFAVVAFLRESLGSEQIASYAGLIGRFPITVVMFSLVLFSLVGLPPLAGFFGKFAVFAALVAAWKTTGSGFMLVLLVVGGLNTAVSLFYYLRVVKVMTIDAEPDDSTAVSARPISWLAGTYLALLTIPIVTMLIYMDAINRWTHAAAAHIL